MQLYVNRGEGRHQLTHRLFFAHQGAFQTGDYLDNVTLANPQLRESRIA
jgi:hypothetical protein